MAANNYFGFTHGGTQYGTATAGAAYAGGQTGYAVAPAATAATYGTQRAAAAGYDTAYQAAATQGTYAGAQAGTYQLAYGRTAAQQTYDASKSAYYQQAAAAAAATAYPAAQQQTPQYEPAPAPKPAYTTNASYAQSNAARSAQPAKATQYGSTYGAGGGSVATVSYPPSQSYPAAPPQPNTQHNTTTPNKQTTAASSTTYSGYDAALYSAATMYVAQQNKGAVGGTGGGGWQGYKKGGGVGGARMRPKQPPKPQQLHYCDVCRISCAGPQTYREHLEGQKHKKKEASMKVTAATAASTTGRGATNSLRCELCDVTCTGNDAYAAHVRGIKHQKVVKLHTRLGKPIPSQEPKVVGSTEKATVTGTAKINFVSSGGLSTVGGGAGGASATEAMGETEGEGAGDTSGTEPEAEVQPVGQDYIEEIKGDDGKVLSFNCKLCDCRFNDPNAKEMHMKGRRHRLQYKKKVQPDLVVDVKPSLRQRKMPGQKMQRMLDELWARRRMHKQDFMQCEMEEEERYWEERRRYNSECDYMDWWRRAAPVPPPHSRPPPLMHPFGPHHPNGPHMMGGRRPESAEDRHMVARHGEIYPPEEELQVIQRVVSHTERALKSLSDTLTELALSKTPNTPAKKSATVVKTETPKPAAAAAAAPVADKAANLNGEKKDEAEAKENAAKEDGRDNQLFSFLQEGEGGVVRVLKGVMRVGLLAKGLLLKGDRSVRLVVLCADKPTMTLLKRVAQELPTHLAKVTDEFKYKVELCPAEGAVNITDGNISVLVSLTSPVMREPNDVGVGSAETPKRDDKDVLPRQKCLDALASLRHAKWFQARAANLQSCVMTIRILRDLLRRIPTWTPLNAWAMELLVEKATSSAGAPLSPGECLRRVMEVVAGGLLLESGPGILDPCEKEHIDAVGNLSPQRREDLTASAQQFLRQIAFKQIHKVLDMDPLPRPWQSRKRRRSQTEGGEVDGKMVKTEGQETMDTEEITAA